MDPFIATLITLAVIGLLAWLVYTYVPMLPPIKQIFVAVVVIGTVLWLLERFGLFSLRGFH